MNLSELKLKIAEVAYQPPLSEMYELKPDARYLLVLDRRRVSWENAKKLAESIGPSTLLLMTEDPADAVRLLTLEPEKENPDDASPPPSR